MMRHSMAEGKRGRTAGGGSSNAAEAEIGEIVHTGGNSRNAFVIERSPFPTVGDGIGVGADFVRHETLEVLAFSVEHAHMRAEKFIGRTYKEIAIKGADVDGTVRRVVDGTDVGRRSRL